MCDDFSGEDILKEAGFTEEQIEQFRAEIQYEMNREKTLVINPQKYLTVLKAYKQLHEMLEKNYEDYTGEEYTIQIEKGKTPSSEKDLTILIKVNVFEIINKIPEYDSMCLSKFDDTMCMQLTYDNVFIEIPTDENQ